MTTSRRVEDRCPAWVRTTEAATRPAYENAALRTRARIPHEPFRASSAPKARRPGSSRRAVRAKWASFAYALEETSNVLHGGDPSAELDAVQVVVELIEILREGAEKLAGELDALTVGEAPPQASARWQGARTACVDPGHMTLLLSKRVRPAYAR
jgi:hypothetical protein